MVKTVGDNLRVEVIKKYPELVLRKFSDESNAQYHRRLISSAILPHFEGRICLSELCEELEWITEKNIRVEFLLMSIFYKESEISFENGIVKFKKMPLNEKKSIRKIAKDSISDKGEILLDDLRNLIERKTRILYTREDVMEALLYKNSKFKILFYETEARVFYQSE